MKRILSMLMMVVMVAGVGLDSKAAEMSQDEKMAWWREARFGMFIHWGLYSVAEGEFEGQKCRGKYAEWIMSKNKIPNAKYEKLADQFNPTKFDAESWVTLAKEAGMKYIVITAKHHDGFAMYDSKVSDYDVVDSTPWGRDPMVDLRKACDKHGIKLCFYYSHWQDWRHPGGDGNDWDFDRSQDKKGSYCTINYERFAPYWREKCIPQVRELLTKYGELGIMWFDMWTSRQKTSVTEEQLDEMIDMIHDLQPQCIINKRIGSGRADYLTMQDNRYPSKIMKDDWETPATINDTWGYSKHDDNWKSTRELLGLLVGNVSKGGNYLLNIGPKADGSVPEESVLRLREIGRWMKANGESIYGASYADLEKPEWGHYTKRDRNLYAHVFDWPESGKIEVDVPGNDVESVQLLTSRASVKFKRGGKSLVVDLPAEPADELDTVIRFVLK